MDKNQRPDWDNYFMEIAEVVAKRSNCCRRSVAAVIVKDNRVISTGYNGTPRGITNCFDGGCERCNSDVKSGEGLTDCICAHAEENAIVQAAYHGISVKDSTIYTTFSPCPYCTRMIINSGIKEVIYKDLYTIEQKSIELLEKAGIKFRKLHH